MFLTLINLLIFYRCSRGLAIILVACIWQTAGAAESGLLSLAEAQGIAVSRALQLSAQDAATTAARDMAVAAGQLPDPVLKLGVDNLPVNGPDSFSLTRDFMTMRRIGIMQELPRGEKRKLKAERFEHDAQRLEAERLVTLASVQRDTALAWLDRYYAQTMREQLLLQQQETALQVQSAETAFRSGRGSQSDVFAARAAVVGLEDRLSQTDRQLRSAALVLARWVGTAADRPLAGAPPWNTSTFDQYLNPLVQGQVFSEHIKEHPQMASLAAQVQAAQAEARLAQANKSADWSVEATYSQRGPAFSNMLSLGLSVPLQWDKANRQDRELAAKLAMVNESQARYDDMLRSHEAELRVLQNDWQSGKERVARFGLQLVPLAHQRTEAALAVYRSGKGDLAAVLAARRDEIDVRLQAITAEMETARLWAQLNFLIPDRTTAALH